jgi:hypothetical protein
MEDCDVARELGSGLGGRFRRPDRTAALGRLSARLALFAMITTLSCLALVTKAPAQQGGETLPYVEPGSEGEAVPPATEPTAPAAPAEASPGITEPTPTPATGQAPSVVPTPTPTPPAAAGPQMESEPDILWMPLPDESMPEATGPAPAQTAPTATPSAPAAAPASATKEPDIQWVPLPETGTPASSVPSAAPTTAPMTTTPPATPSEGSEGLQTQPQPYEAPAPTDGKTPTAPTVTSPQPQPYQPAPTEGANEQLPIAPQPYQAPAQPQPLQAPEQPQPMETRTQPQPLQRFETPTEPQPSEAPAQPQPVSPPTTATPAKTTETVATPKTPPLSETPEEKGLRIAREADAEESGYGSTRANALMILRDRQNRTSERQFEASTLEGVGGEGTKSLIVFRHPKDVEGTALLTHTHLHGDDDQWLYLPALKRVKRISAPDQTGSFMSSEFSYEDMITPEVEKFSYRWLRDEPCPRHESLMCYVYDRYPQSRNSGYSREIVWMDKQEYRVYKVDYYDRKSSLLKTLTVNDYKVYKRKYWRAIDVLMENHQNGKSTTMAWKNYDFDVDLDENDFSRYALETLR